MPLLSKRRGGGLKGKVTMNRQILPLNSIIRFQGPISRVNDRRRIELNSTFKRLFKELDADSYYVIELTLSKERLVKRLNQLIQEEKILPSLIYFCKKEKMGYKNVP